jgi:squalene-hopene/tetraprenyl-beta-curcumene cyclase
MKTFAVLLLAVAATARADEPPAWDRAAALRHLDDRAQAWLDFGGAYRGQGETRTTCLSCHSFVPYLLARATTPDIPAGPRAKSLDQIKQRVAHWSELDTPAWKLPYDHSAAKKKESRGTEAVLNALILASDDRARGLDTPSPSTKAALDHLWSTQRTDGPDAGSWDWLDFGLEPWEASDGRFYGATLAARAIGTAPREFDAQSAGTARAKRLRDYLRSHAADQGLFNRVALLRASPDLHGPLTDPERTKLVDEILALQRPDGGWSLASLGEYERSDHTPEDKDSDGLATGFVVDALRASGLPRSHPAVTKGLDWLRGHQQKDGGWITVSLNKKRDPKSHVGQFMSDAATAYAVLALTRD